MHTIAIILGGGHGLRAGGPLPKQFQILHSQPVLMHSIAAFKAADSECRLIVVLPQEYITQWSDKITTLYPGTTIVAGGISRRQSVQNALAAISEIDQDTLIAVHDGARPCVDPYLIKRGLECAQCYGAAVPIIPVTDSLRLLQNNDATTSQAVDRSHYVAVQTPQIFQASILLQAYDNANSDIYTDDASLVESLGTKVTLYSGSPRNIKITNPQDIQIAEILIDTPQMQ